MTDRELVVTCDDSGNVIVNAPDGRQLAAACNATAGFSSIELLQAALGNCMAASLAPLLKRHGADTAGLRVSITAHGAPFVQRFTVIVALPAGDPELRTRCERAAVNCPVQRALNIPVDIHWKTN